MGVVAELADRVQVMYAGRIVEQGPTRDDLPRPAHPYTWGLLDSIPRLDRPRPRRLHRDPGHAARRLAHAAGCVFADRCPHAFDRCSTAAAAARPSAGTAATSTRCSISPIEHAPAADCGGAGEQ